MYGHDTWWVWSTFNIIFFKWFKVIRGHSRSNPLEHNYVYLFQGHHGVIQGQISSLMSTDMILGVFTQHSMGKKNEHYFKVIMGSFKVKSLRLWVRTWYLVCLLNIPWGKRMKLFQGHYGVIRGQIHCHMCTDMVTPMFYNAYYGIDTLLRVT